VQPSLMPTQRYLGLRIAALVFAVCCSGFFLWAVQWNWTIGTHASDTGGSGANNAAWVALGVGSLAFLLSILVLVVVFTRVRRHR